MRGHGANEALLHRGVVFDWPRGRDPISFAIMGTNRSKRAALIVIAACTLACSGAASSEPQAPLATTPARSGHGLGRLPDSSASACTHDRASVPLDSSATPTECHQDSDCTGVNGRCLRLSNRGGHGPSLEATVCTYDRCFADSDCEPRQTCSCGARSATDPGLAHACVSAYCMTDAECAGGYCRRTPNGNICHTFEDECAEETNCGAGMICDREGGPMGTGAWRCMPFTPPSG